jgi:RHS repeat-associated protein
MVQLAEETREVDLLGMGVCVRVPWARGIARVRDGQAADFARTRESDYLIDANNPTGYAQVIEAWNPGPTLIRCHTIGLDLVTQWTTNCGLVYLLTDGHGSTRLVTDPDGDVTHDPYNQQDQWFTYDAYGNMLSSFSGAVLTDLLYAGEQRDADTDLYYLRARYYDPSTGRFTALDPAAGSPQDPISLHKYLYCGANPVMNTDPTGTMSLGELAAVTSITTMLANCVTTFLATTSITEHIKTRGCPDGVFLSFGGVVSCRGFTAGVTPTFYYDFDSRVVSLLITGEAGLAPLSIFHGHQGLGALLMVGLSFNANGPEALSGLGSVATWPAVMAKTVLPINIRGWYYFLTALAARNVSGTQLTKHRGVIQFGYSFSGAAYLAYGLYFNVFAATVGYTSHPITLGEVPHKARAVFEDVKSMLLDYVQ